MRHFPLLCPTPLRRGALIVFVLLAVSCSSPPIDAVELAKVDEPMPVLQGDTLDGGTFGPSDYQGKPVVMNAWASWCYPCRQEQPMLNAMFERYGDRVVFVGLNSKDTDTAAAQEHAREFAIPYPSVVDQNGSIAMDGFGLTTGLPGTVIADATGQMRYRFKGQIGDEELTRMIDDVLASPTPAAP